MAKNRAAVLLALLGLGVLYSLCSLSPTACFVAAREGGRGQRQLSYGSGRGASERCAVVHRQAGGLSTSSGKPVLYVYDHCPFCCRARMSLGFKKVPHHLVWMANDDVDTPTTLVGKKIAPILQLPCTGGSAPEVMPESLDIVKRVDEGEEFGPPVLQPASGREDLKEWWNDVSGLMRLLVTTRCPRAFFPEFASASGREAFIRNHPVPDPETGVKPTKEAWVEMGRKKWDEWFDKHIDNTPELLEKLNKEMPTLEKLIDSEESVSAGGIGYDDIVFWNELRGATLIKGLQFGPRAKAYVEKISEKSDVPLLTSISM